MSIKLYYGTVDRVAKQAPSKGIQSEEPLILTTVYGAFQALQASQPEKNERWAIIELAPSILKESALHPCTEWLEGKLKGANKTWKKSLEMIGLCSYNGLIPAAAISKVWTYNPYSNWMVTRTVLHTQINIKSFAAERKRLLAINRWLTGDFVTVEDWLGDQKNQFSREQKNELNVLWHERGGLDLFYRG